MNDYLRKFVSGYYNYTPPQTITGNKMPHYSDEIDTSKLLSDYYNVGYKPPINVISPDSIYTIPSRFYQEKNFEPSMYKYGRSLLDYVQELKKAVAGNNQIAKEK